MVFSWILSGVTACRFCSSSASSGAVSSGFSPWAWPADSAAHWASRAESPSSSRCQKGTGPSPAGAWAAMAVWIPPSPPSHPRGWGRPAVTAAMPIPTMANRQAMLRRRKRRTCPLAFCFFIGITLPYASILCTAVQVQNLSPAEKEVPPLKKLWTSPFVLFLREAIMLYFSRRVPQAAACLAYFVLLTVFPVLICVSYILGMVNIDIVSLMDQLQPLLPEAALDVLESYLRYISFHQTPGLFLAGLAGCWFSAAAAFRTITRVIIDMYEDVSQSMVRGMVASILFPLGLLVTVDLSVIVVVTGQRTLAAVAQRFPFWDHMLNLWSWTRYVLLFSIFFLFILAVLNMAAPFGTPRLPVLLSSLVSALALVVSSAVFSWFISMSSRYSLVYGSLVSLIILLIWLYLCGQILFIGIVFTSVWYKHWRRRRLTDPDD